MGCGAAVGVLGVPIAIGYVPSSLEGSGPVGSGGLTSRVCVFTKGTSPSRRVPSYNLLQVGAHTLQILRMVSAQEDMFMFMFMFMFMSCACARRQGARHAAAQVDGRFRKVKRPRRAAAPPPRRNRPVVAHVVLSNTNAQAGAGGPGPLTEVMSHLLLVLCPGLQYDA